MKHRVINPVVDFRNPSGLTILHKGVSATERNHACWKLGQKGGSALRPDGGPHSPFDVKERIGSLADRLLLAG